MICPLCGYDHDTTACPRPFQTIISPALVPHCCPVCGGTGLVSRPPGVAGDVPEWVSSGAGPYPCRACGGTGIVWGAA